MSGGERGSWTERGSIQGLVSNARDTTIPESEFFWRNNKCHLVASLGIATLHYKIPVFTMFRRKIKQKQTHMNPWLIHVDVWQKPLQYCKVISLQLIKIIGKKIKKAQKHLKKSKIVCLISAVLVSSHIKKGKICINDLQQPLHIILYNSSFPLKIFCLPGIMQTQWGISGGLEFFIVVVRGS